MGAKSAHLNKRRIDRKGLDFYPTKPWAVKALLSVESFRGEIHEPCCGEGHISKVLLEHGYKVNSSDLYDYGFGRSGIDVERLARVANIVTNPPYSILSRLLPFLVGRVTSKLALLLKLDAMAGVSRYQLFEREPPATVWAFAERLTLNERGEDSYGKGMLSYAWFVWDKTHVGPTRLRWIPPVFGNEGKSIEVRALDGINWVRNNEKVVERVGTILGVLSARGELKVGAIDWKRVVLGFCQPTKYVGGEAVTKLARIAEIAFVMGKAIPAERQAERVRAKIEGGIRT